MDLNRMLNNELLRAIPKHQTCRMQESKREYVRSEIAKNTLIQVSKYSHAPSVDIKIDYAETPPDMSTCRTCRETIYSVVKTMQVKLNDEVIAEPLKLCEFCYDKSRKL